MAGDEPTSEPNGYELNRRMTEMKTDLQADLHELKDLIGAVGGRVVSIELYNADKQGNAERHVRAEDRIQTLEATAGDADKQRRQLRLTIALAILAPLVSAALALLIKVVVP